MTDLQPLGITPCLPADTIVIAGPCSAESEQQVLDTASELASFGFNTLRAGVWKPRTKPGGFEGMGAAALPWLAKAKQATGMKLAVEVATRAHVEASIEAGVDILWIGARTSANPFAMQEVADALRDLDFDGPVLVKNPVNPDLELWVGALQRIYNAGIRRLGAIHRGFSSYGKHLYRNPPQWCIPIELRRRFPNLPIICDPSHMGGSRELIKPLSQQALDMGFNGLIIESHCNPDVALSDKAQQLTPFQLKAVIASLVVRNGSSSAENLSAMRLEIDRIDSDLIELLARRMEVSREIGLYKEEHHMPVLQTGRYDSIYNSRLVQAAKMGMSEDFMRSILAAIHEESVRQQIDVFNKRSALRK